MEVVKPGRPQYELAFGKFIEASFLQSWAWGEANRQNHKIERLAVLDGEEVIALAQIIIKDARRGRYAEVAGGPLLDWRDEKLVELVWQEIKRVATEHRCVFVRLRPQVQDSVEFQGQLRRLGAKKAPMHLHAEHTNIVDLRPSEADLMQAMRRQTRYEVRQVVKKGLSVFSTDSDQLAVERFVALQAETAIRQGFIPPSADEVKNIFASFGDQARIYEVWHQDSLLNMALVVSAGLEADYLEAASTPEARGFPGSYALVWEAMRDAKAAGRERFNLWGIAYSDDPKHRYAKVTTFKRGFGGEDVSYVPAHDIVIKPVRYLFDWLIETARRKRRGL